MTDYDAGYLIGVLFGVVVAGAALVIFLLFTRKDRSMKCKYDERQEIVRGKGYRYAFGTLLVYNMVYAMLGNYMEFVAVREVILSLGIILCLLVYVSYTVWNDGYFSLNEKPKSWVGIFTAVAVLNIANGIRNMSVYGVVQDGVISESVINLMFGVCLLLILAVMLLKRFCKKSEGQDEE